MEKICFNDRDISTELNGSLDLRQAGAERR